MPEIVALDHVQLAMPRGGEAAARAFFVEVLGFIEEAKPPSLAFRGGLWLRGGSARLHLGVADPFVAARKAHPAFLVDDLAGYAQRLAAAGHSVTRDLPLPGYDRFYLDDPFGNRLELLQPMENRSVPGEA